MCVKSDILNLIDATIANGKYFVSCCLKIKNNKTFLEFLLSSTAWLNQYDPPLIERLYCLYHNIIDTNAVTKCGKKLKFKNWHQGYA